MAITDTIDPSQSTLSPNFADYIYRMLARGEQAAGLPFQEYTGQRYAGTQPLLQEAFRRYQGLTEPSQFGEATGIARLAAQRAQGLGYTPGQFAPERVGAERVAARDIQAAQTGFRPDLRTYQMQAPMERVTAETFTRPGIAGGYMSPFIQQALAPQMREAVRQSDIARTGRQARFAQAGAFGGSRQAIEEAEAQRNLEQRLGDIQSTGLQQAYQSAQEQFNREQAARQAAQQANIGTGLTVGRENLAAQLGVQQLGTQTGLQAALANLTAEQQARVQSAANQLQAQGMNQQQALQAAMANQQQGMEAQRQAEASRQFGARYGLEGIQQQLGAGQLMSGIGSQAGQLGISGLTGMLGAGQQQQALAQQPLDFGYQQFQQSQQYPFQQATYMQSLLGGLPLAARPYDPGTSAFGGALQGLALGAALSGGFKG